jgi:hypothetical protein
MDFLKLAPVSPYFSGAPVGFEDWAFRVQAKLRGTKEEERKYLPARSIEGLHAAALRVTQRLKVHEMEAEKGVNALVETMRSLVLPLAKQEVRELFHEGSKRGGTLARQPAEQMTRYILRRGAWHDKMTALDPEVQVSEALRADLLSQNSCLDNTHRLLILTACANEYSWDKISKTLRSSTPTSTKKSDIPQGRPSRTAGARLKNQHCRQLHAELQSL